MHRIFAQLARNYAIADNYHQPVMGGTGANFLALSTGHAGAYVIDGRPAAPPANQIENPDPRSRNQQLVQGIRLPRRLVHGLRRCSQPGVKADPRLPRDAALQDVQRRQLRARHLLPRQQLRARLLVRRQAEAARPGSSCCRRRSRRISGRRSPPPGSRGSGTAAAATRPAASTATATARSATR